jgi:predicted histidine transporter YuiF (NhaC family)
MGSMKESSSILLATLILLTFFCLMRRVYRSWGKAFLATLFTPLVAFPLGLVTLVGVSFLLRGINAVLSVLHLEIAGTALTIAAISITTGIVLAIGFFYYRDQRYLSTVNTGPRFGPRNEAPTPNINQKRALH